MKFPMVKSYWSSNGLSGPSGSPGPVLSMNYIKTRQQEWKNTHMHTSLLGRVYVNYCKSTHYQKKQKSHTHIVW